MHRHPILGAARQSGLAAVVDAQFEFGIRHLLRDVGGFPDGVEAAVEEDQEDWKVSWLSNGPNVLPILATSG